MPIGAGKYDHLCTYVMEQSHATGAAVIIFNGDRGAGFSIQAPLEVQLGIADILEYMAKEIRKSTQEGQL